MSLPLLLLQPGVAPGSGLLDVGLKASSVLDFDLFAGLGTESLKVLTMDNSQLKPELKPEQSPANKPMLAGQQWLQVYQPMPLTQPLVSARLATLDLFEQPLPELLLSEVGVSEVEVLEPMVNQRDVTQPVGPVVEPMSALVQPVNLNPVIPVPDEVIKQPLILTTPEILPVVKVEVKPEVKVEVKVEVKANVQVIMTSSINLTDPSASPQNQAQSIIQKRVLWSAVASGDLSQGYAVNQSAVDLVSLSPVSAIQKSTVETRLNTINSQPHLANITVTPRPMTMAATAQVQVEQTREQSRIKAEQAATVEPATWMQTIILPHRMGYSSQQQKLWLRDYFMSSEQISELVDKLDRHFGGLNNVIINGNKLNSLP
ncbi:MAG: hypothetical protein ACI8WB_001310 [Phenylobacterium sp.]|jgi:hypothetical protein